MVTDTAADVEITVQCEVCGEPFTALYDPDDRRFKPWNDHDKNCRCFREAMARVDLESTIDESTFAEVRAVAERQSRQIAEFVAAAAGGGSND